MQRKERLILKTCPSCKNSQIADREIKCETCGYSFRFDKGNDSLYSKSELENDVAVIKKCIVFFTILTVLNLIGGLIFIIRMMSIF